MIKSAQKIMCITRSETILQALAICMPRLQLGLSKYARTCKMSISELVIQITSDVTNTSSTE